MAREGLGMGHREAILKAATMLFQERGFSRTTTDEIAMEAQISKRTLYRYMDSKEAVLLAIHETLLERLLAPVDLRGSLEAQFCVLIQNYVETVVQHQDEIRVFFEERKHLSPSNLAHVVERRDQHEKVFRDILVRGTEAGVFRDVDVSLATEGVLGTVAGLYEWYKPEGLLSPTQISEMISTLFLGGLVAAAKALPASAGAKMAPSSSGRSRATRATAVDSRRQADLGTQPSWDDNPVLANILDVAADLFYEHGYDKTSTRELAEAAGLTKSALYYHIPNKESVLFQLNLRLTVRGNESVKRIIQDNSDPVEALRAIIVSHCVSVAKNLGALRALNYEMRFLVAPHYNQIKSLREEYASLFCSAVHAACPEPNTDTRSAVIGVGIMGMLNFMNQWYTPGGRLEPHLIGESFFDIVWNGLSLTSSPASR